MKRRSCTCGEYEEQIIPSTGHNGTWQTTTSPSCTQEGEAQMYCSACKQTFTKTLETTPHEWEYSERLTDPTYAKDGTQMSYCKNCPHSEITPVTRLGFEEKGKAVFASKKVKILSIGNSVTDDAHQYLHDVLHEIGFTDVTLGKVWLGGSTLPQHVANAQKSTKYTWEYYNENNGAWVKSGNITILNALKWADWDYVTLQTSNIATAMPQMVLPKDLKFMSDYIYENTADALPVFYIPAMYGITSNAYPYLGPNITLDQVYTKGMEVMNQVVVPRLGTEYLAILPTRTAAYNMYKLYQQNDQKNSVTHRDGGHSSYANGCTLIAMSWAKTFFPQCDLNDISLDYISPAVMKDLVACVESMVESPYQWKNLPFGAEAIDGWISASGGYSEENGVLISTNRDSLLVKQDSTFKSGKLKTSITPGVNGWCGLIFGLSSTTSYFWETGANYYFAAISEFGKLCLVKVNGTATSVWNVIQEVEIPNYHMAKTYEIAVDYNSTAGTIAVSLDGVQKITYTDSNPLTGTAYGIRSEFRSTAYTLPTIANA